MKSIAISEMRSSTRHNPNSLLRNFCISDYNDMMDLTEDMLRKFSAVMGTTQVVNRVKDDNGEVQSEISLILLNTLPYVGV